MLKHRQYIYFYIFSRATLNETFTAKYDGVLPRKPQVRPKFDIYTPKREDEHPHLFHMRSPPPLPPPGLEAQMQTQGNTRVKWPNANHCKHKRKRSLKNGVGVVIVFRGVGCCDLEKAAFRLRLRHRIVGNLSNNNGDGYENDA